VRAAILEKAEFGVNRVCLFCWRRHPNPDRQGGARGEGRGARGETLLPGACVALVRR
jgi:hypothetical protein